MHELRIIFNYLPISIILIRFYFNIVMNVSRTLLRRLYPDELDNKVHEFRVKDDRRLSSLPPPLFSQTPVSKLCESSKGFRPTLKGYCFGYREFALFPPTGLIVRSFLNVAFSVTNSSSLRIARCICAGVISDAIECRRFSAPNLFNVSHSAGSLYPREDENVSQRESI